MQGVVAPEHVAVCEICGHRHVCRLDADDDDRGAGIEPRIRACISSLALNVVADTLSERDMATVLGLNRETLRRWRNEREGMPVVKIGSRYRWTISGIARLFATNDDI